MKNYGMLVGVCGVTDDTVKITGPIAKAPHGYTAVGALP
jgi:hypothetical protein